MSPPNPETTWVPPTGGIAFFSVFVRGEGTVPLDPTNNQVRITFSDRIGVAGFPLPHIFPGDERGAISVAVRTAP